ncbi:hypothetical protein [Nonomuraea basaltis]|uniref:hypothetical protein n=1 Tax=Nonomuraea basaltis TaxID=2495887 RepID=UPI00110C5B86|nr:hypothetical protein [Nonomuraea basaltis]TMR88392.1 hypothetical protein EJK15_66490 [Nonomuraea basaltis]
MRTAAATRAGRRRSARPRPALTALLSPNIHLLSAHLIALPSGTPRTIRTPERPGWHRDMYGVTHDLGPCDVVLFENRTFHASGVNTSGQPRIAFMLQYGYRWLQPVDDPAPQLQHRADLDPITRQLLGAPDRNPDGSLAKGRGAAPLR